MTTKHMIILILLILLLPLPIIELGQYVHDKLTPSQAWWEVATICNPSDNFEEEVSADAATLFVVVGIGFLIEAIVVAWYDHYKEEKK